MASIIACKSPLKGKSFSCIETTVKLSPCASSVKVLSSCCLYGRVIAPMNVDEATVVEFVAKTWKKQISVVPMVDIMKTANIFKFGFGSAEDRDWALVNGPWCIRGYTLVLHAWSPSVEGSITLNMLRVWIQIHNLPHEYFSRDNGYLLGGLVGKVVRLDLEEDKPATWTTYLMVQVDIDVQKPLVSGCFFDLIYGEKQWLQVKYVKIGIFCYNCGCLGHQRRGCKLSSPVTVAKVDGVPYPMFGPWLSLSSAYHDVFSGPSYGVPRRQALMKISDVDGDGSKTGQALKVRRPRRPVSATSRAAAVPGKSLVWFPKQRVVGVETGVSNPSMGGTSGALVIRKGSDHVSVLRGDEVDCSLGRDKVFKNLAVSNLDLIDGPSFGPGVCGSGPSGQMVQGEKGDLQKDKFSGPPNLNCGIIRTGPEVGINNVIITPSLKESEGPVVSFKAPPSIGPVSLEKLSDENRGPSSPRPNIEHASSMLPNEDRALAQFFKAQEDLMNDLKHFGKLDLYEIRRIGGDIGVPASSDVNERTTPFKKRKFESSASLCSRPHKIHRKYPGVVRDFPWDSRREGNEAELVVDEPSEDSSNSPSRSERNISSVIT
ncbi:hypothetical protein F8388_017901 [Cannabis sativa]|uniref:CCHC-type domain-containing protein n=1 Tax=Cannabis sativa TaxID=3483 RepID=A0A7J6EG94_CANSA|nr:hypothetical protein G4B88_009710 [Cannabis sativa]KAF4365335.1 hypothetical protein F8388_017901 [Cannabis sativa]